jgi:hypothetical protein
MGAHFGHPFLHVLLGRGLTSFNQVVDAEQNQRSDEGHEKSRRLIFIVVTNEAAKKSSKKRACYTDEHRDKNTARLFAWNDELGDCSDNKTNESRPQQMKHSVFLRIYFPGSPDKVAIDARRILLPVLDARK